MTDTSARADSSNASAVAASNAIIGARVLAIFFVMYVHAWPGLDFLNKPLPAMSGFDLTRAVLVDIFGRSSVPALTIISGWLLARQTRRAWTALMREKFRTLLLPMILWNLLFLTMLALLAAAKRESLASLTDNVRWYDMVTALTAPPLLEPLAFLRDLFVCMALSPALLALMRRAPLAVGIAAFLFAAWNPVQPILLRPQILFFFTIGIGFASVWPLPTLRDRWLPLAAFAAVGVILWRFLLLHGSEAAMNAVDDPMRHALNNAARVAVAYLLWITCLKLATSPAQHALRRIEPYVFLTFCAHPILFQALGYMDFPTGNPAAGLLFLAQPFVAFATCYLAARALMRLAPALLAPFNAGRLPQQRRSIAA